MLVQVKGNQARLFELCQLLERHFDWADQDQTQCVAHGRREIRQVHTYLPEHYWLPPEWNCLIKTVVKVTRTCHHRRHGKQETSVETAWWISTTVLSAKAAQQAIRGHWQIENQFHHVRDVALQEDACRTRTQPGILARLRSMALNCLRADGAPSISRAILRNALNFRKAVAMAGQ